MKSPEEWRELAGTLARAEEADLAEVRREVSAFLADLGLHDQAAALEDGDTDRDHAVQRLKILTRVIASVVHELQNPHHYIAMNIAYLREVWSDVAPLLAQRAKADPKLRIAEVPVEELNREVPELLNEMEQGVEHLRKLVSELGSCFRPVVAGAESVARLNETLERAALLLATPLRRLPHKVQFELEESLPEVAFGPRELELVVLGLLQWFSESQTETSEPMIVRANSTSREVALTFECHDPHSPVRLTPRVFESAGDRDRDGASLWFVANLVQRHGGSITVSESESEVTCLVVRFAKA